MEHEIRPSDFEEQHSREAEDRGFSPEQLAEVDEDLEDKEDKE